MKAYDFEYAGKTLSSFGMVLCNFGGSKGLETVTDGASINFNTVPVMGGLKHNLTSTNYEDCLEATLQICKHSCDGSIQEITAIEHRELTRWLCRKKFLKFKILDEDNIDIYHEALINVSRIEFDGKLVGLELEIRTNRPFALKEPKTMMIKPLYIWEKYEAIEVKNWWTQLSDIVYTFSALDALPDNCSGTPYAKFDITDQGEITLSSPIIEPNDSSIRDMDIAGDYYYHWIWGDGTYDLKRCWVANNNEKTFKIMTVSFQYDIGYQKGEYLNNVSSDKITTYPIDGQKDKYWYTYIDEWKSSLNDNSYEEGYIYPYTEITINKDGNLDIYNAIEDRHTFIANCKAGEVITFDYPVIRSSDSSHNIQNDFNWNFFRIANTYNNSRNDLTISLPCSIKIKYSPIVKVGL